MNEFTQLTPEPRYPSIDARMEWLPFGRGDEVSGL